MIPVVCANLLILKIETDQRIVANDKAVKKTFANPWLTRESYHKNKRKDWRADSSPISICRVITGAINPLATAAHMAATAANE